MSHVDCCDTEKLVGKLDQLCMKKHHGQIGGLLYNQIHASAGQAANQIHEMFVVYKGVCPLYGTVKCWKSHYQTGHSIVFKMNQAQTN